MSKFVDVGANCFLSSDCKEKILAPNPTTERGQSLHINAHPKEPRIIYPCGKYIVVKSLVDPSDNFVYRGHLVMATVAKFSPNGYWVASADIAGKVRIWSWDNPEHLIKIETQVFGGPVYDLDWDPESKKVVAVGESTGLQAKCFTWDTGNSVGEMTGHTKRVRSVSYKPTRPFRIASGAEDFQIIIYNGPPFKLEKSQCAHTNFVNCVRYAPNGQFFISVGTDKKIQVYDGANGGLLRDVPNAHDGGVYSVSVSPDSKRFATASADKTVKVWDAETLALLQTLAVSPDPQLPDAQVAVLWTAGHLVSVSLNGNVNLFDPAVSSPVRLIQANQTSISAVYLHKPTGSLLTGSLDGVVVHRNSVAVGTEDAIRFIGKDKRNISGSAHSGKVVGLGVTAAGEVVSAGWDDTLRFADLSTKTYHSEVLLETIPLNGQPVALSVWGELVLVVTNAELALFKGHTKAGSLDISRLAYSPTSGTLLEQQEVAVGGSDNKVHIFRIDAQGDGFAFSEVTTLAGSAAVTALAYSPAGDKLAVGDVGRQVEVYERSSWTPLVMGRWVSHTSRVTALAWAADGVRLASGSLDENIFVWSLAAFNKSLQLPFAHSGGVTGIEWSNEARLISAGNDSCVVTWKIPLEI